MDGGGGGGDGDGNGDGNDGVTGIQLSIRRISPAALRRFGVRPTQAAYLYRCLAGFSAGFHDAVAECTRESTVRPGARAGSGGAGRGLHSFTFQLNLSNSRTNS